MISLRYYFQMFCIAISKLAFAKRWFCTEFLKVKREGGGGQDTQTHSALPRDLNFPPSKSKFCQNLIFFYVQFTIHLTVPNLSSTWDQSFSFCWNFRLELS